MRRKIFTSFCSKFIHENKTHKISSESPEFYYTEEITANILVFFSGHSVYTPTCTIMDMIFVSATHIWALMSNCGDGGLLSIIIFKRSNNAKNDEKRSLKNQSLPSEACRNFFCVSCVPGVFFCCCLAKLLGRTHILLWAYARKSFTTCSIHDRTKIAGQIVQREILKKMKKYTFEKATKCRRHAQILAVYIFSTRHAHSWRVFKLIQRVITEIVPVWCFQSARWWSGGLLFYSWTFLLSVQIRNLRKDRSAPVNISTQKLHCRCGTKHWFTHFAHPAPNFYGGSVKFLLKSIWGHLLSNAAYRKIATNFGSVCDEPIYSRSNVIGWESTLRIRGTQNCPPSQKMDARFLVHCVSIKKFILFTVAALNQGAPGQMTRLEDPPPWLEPWLKPCLALRIVLLR